MAPITGKGFKLIAPLSNTEIVNLCVPGTGNVAARALQDKKLWDGSPTLFFFTHLGSDNQRINSCHISALGNWHTEIVISPHRFCPSVDDESSITIKKLNLCTFKFDEHLVSQCLPLSAFEPTITVEGDNVSWDEFVELGGREMCLRAHITPVSDHTAKLTIMLVPESLQELKELTCVSGLVPGFTVVSRELSISPAARMEWGLAFVTLFIKGDPAGDMCQINQTELRRAIHRILQGSIMIKACRQLDSYRKRMEKLKNGEVVEPTPTDLWPDIQDPTAIGSGKNIYTIEYNF